MQQKSLLGKGHLNFVSSDLCCSQKKSLLDKKHLNVLSSDFGQCNRNHYWGREFGEKVSPEKGKTFIV
jgi:hypothetical protein